MGVGSGRGAEQVKRIKRYKQPVTKQIDNKDVMCSTGNRVGIS